MAADVAIRSGWRLTARRFFRDRVAVVGLAAFLLVAVTSFGGGPLLSSIVGHNGYTLFPYGVIDTGTGLKPVGLWSHVPTTSQVRVDQYNDTLPPPKSAPRTLFIAGADGPLGRDELLRVLDGGKASLEVGLGGVLVAILIAVPLGALAGFFGGPLDYVISRLTETIMAFPLILFLVFATVRIAPTLRSVGWGRVIPAGVPMMALLIGVFTSFYPLRLIRAQVLGLRHAEFVEAARALGSSSMRIIRKHLLPHLVPTLLVWGAVAVATNMLLEVGLSVIGVGVQSSTATWGTLLASTTGTIYAAAPASTENYTIWQTLFPSIAILVAVVSLNQLSEGLRRALEPRDNA
jgi:peptide/nickel transport system permease protein